VSAKGLDVCAVGKDGRVFCFDESLRLEPIQGISDATSVAVAGGLDRAACALRSDGSVVCWGANRFGIDVVGTDDPTIPPTEAASLGDDTSQIELGSRGGCALKTDGSVWCWGLTSDALSPVDLPLTALKVSVGFEHACAVLSDASLWCWGSNPMGQTGEGPSELPHRVDALGNSASDVAAGPEHTCALHTGGTVSCWGSNEHRELGVDTAPETCSGKPCSRVPATINELTQARSLTIGDTGFYWGHPFTCAINGSGDVSCWPPFGTESAGVSTLRDLGSDNAQFAVGRTPCALKDDGGLWCLRLKDWWDEADLIRVPGLE